MTMGHHDTESTTGRNRLSLQKIRRISDTTLFHVLQKERDHDLKKRLFSPFSNRIARNGESGNEEGTGLEKGVESLFFQISRKVIHGVHSIFTQCRLLSLRHLLNGLNANGKSTPGTKSRRRPEEVRWYFITSDELMDIQKRLHTFEALPMDEKQLSVLEIIGIITKVELRPA